MIYSRLAIIFAVVLPVCALPVEFYEEVLKLYADDDNPNNHYSNHYFVKVKGGWEKAQEVARRDGFKLLYKVHKIYYIRGCCRVGKAR